MNHRQTRGCAVGLAVVAVLGAAGCSDSAAADQLPTEQEIAGQFDRWNAALATGDAERVADEYAPDSVLLPTLSDVVRPDRASKIEYFADDFLPRKPQGKIVESHIAVLDEDTATHSGTYDFTVTDDSGATSVIHARFTYVYEKTAGRWLIVGHHSSLVPPS